MRPAYLRGGSLEAEFFEAGLISTNDHGDYQPSTPRNSRNSSRRRQQSSPIQEEQLERLSGGPATPAKAPSQSEPSTPPTPRPPALDQFPALDVASDPRGPFSLDEHAAEDNLIMFYLLENARLLTRPAQSPAAPADQQQCRRFERLSERRENLPTLTGTPRERSRSLERGESTVPILDTNNLLERTEPSSSLLARITGAFRNGKPLTVRSPNQSIAPQPTERGHDRERPTRYRGNSRRTQSIDGFAETYPTAPVIHVENVCGVHLEFQDHEPLPQMPTQDGRTELRVRQRLPITKEQLARQAGIIWAQGSDPRDDVRFETIQAGYNTGSIQVHRTKVAGFPIPRRGSVPIHYELIDGEVGGLQLLQPSHHHRRSPPRRSPSEPARFCPRPAFSPDGTCERKDSREHQSRRSFASQDITQSDGMNPFASFLDQNATGVNNNVARSGPPQSSIQQQQQPQHQVNGSGGVSHVAGLANGVPHAGHQTDINYLWGIVQELSEVLKQNRNQTASIISSVQRVQAQAQEDGTEPSLEQVNGELNANRSAEIADLHSRLSNANRQRDELISETDDLQRLVNDYESTLQGLMEKLRGYAFDHTNAIIATHRHYNALLEKEREANLAMRIEHGDWQAGLGRAAEFARQALNARSDELIPLERKCKELKGENRVLRRLIGWEVEEDSDEEEDRREEERRRNAAESLEQGNLDGHLVAHGLNG